MSRAAANQPADSARPIEQTDDAGVDRALPEAASIRAVLLYVLHGGDLYGTEKMALATAVALTEYPRRVILAPPGNPVGSVPSVLDAATGSGLEAWSYEGRGSLVIQLWRLLRREARVDVITTSITQSLLVEAIAALTRTRLRHLHAVHGGQTTNYRFKPLLAAFSLRYVAVSKHVKQILIDSRVPASRIVIAENFLVAQAGGSVPVREPYECRGLHATGQPVRIVVVGRADSIKRLDMLVDAVESGSLREMRIDVFGDGPDLESLRARAQPYPNLLFHGYGADVPARLAEADLFLHTCDVETFGLVVLEAYQAGVVAIAPDAGGTATLVDPGVTGLLYRAGDVPDMVRTVRRAAQLSNEELDAIATAAKARLSRRFSSEQGALAYRRAFEDLDRRR
ncbi:MAG: glycosyltransferase family 4 protein [Propionicimonas sp.]